jgi:hypothetical protein
MWVGGCVEVKIVSWIAERLLWCCGNCVCYYDFYGYFGYYDYYGHYSNYGYYGYASNYGYYNSHLRIAKKKKLRLELQKNLKCNIFMKK